MVEAACDTSGVVLIDVDDGSGVAPLPGSTNFEEVAGTRVEVPLPVPSPDDLYLVCTGGTTGRPKAVLWRQADIYVSGMAGTEDATEESIAAAALTGGGGPWYPVPPLMHAAAQWTAFSGLHQGATVVLHDDSGPFDARQVLELAERERVALMSIVGDAYAGPLVEELRRRPYDLSSLLILGTGGAATGEQHKEALVELLPNLVIRDGYGSSETGGMAYGARTRNSRQDGASCRARVPPWCRPTGPASWSQERRRSAGRRAGDGSRSATSVTGSARRRPSRSSTASASPYRVTGPSSPPTAAS